MEPIDPRIKAILDHSDTSLANLKLDEFLGGGSYGSVHKVDIEGKKFALKKIKINDDTDNDEEIYENLSCAFSEFQIMNKNLPNVVRSYKYHLDVKKGMFSFTMDLMEKDLGKLISEKKGISFDHVYKLFEEIISGKY